jgi:hypothetical protein
MTGEDINDVGHVVGTMEVPGTGLGRVPFIWDGQVTHWIELPLGAQNGVAYAINNRDEVVGEFDAGPDVRAFHWQAGFFSDIGGMFSVTSRARDINELGDIVGDVTYPGFWPHAFRISGGVLEWLSEPSGLAVSFGTGLNNNGIAVGRAARGQPGPSYPFLGMVWTADTTYVVEEPLADQQAEFFAVNDGGRAIGSCPPFHAPIVWQAGEVVELRPLMVPPPPVGFSLRVGRDINKAGKILTWKNNGSVVLTPVWLPGDLTGDCHVTLDDLLLVLSNFGAPQGTYPRGDVDLDGDVDLSDLTTLLSHWGQ